MISPSRIMMKYIVQVLLLAAASGAFAATCPPSGFDSVSGFNIKKYVEGPWYIQEQVGCETRL